VQNVQICTKYCSKRFGGRAPPGPASGANNAPPDSLAGLRGKGGEGKSEEGRGEKGGERKGKGGESAGKDDIPPFRFSRYAHD